MKPLHLFTWVMNKFICSDEKDWLMHSNESNVDEIERLENHTFRNSHIHAVCVCVCVCDGNGWNLTSVKNKLKNSGWKKIDNEWENIIWRKINDEVAISTRIFFIPSFAFQYTLTKTDMLLKKKLISQWKKQQQAIKERWWKQKLRLNECNLYFDKICACEYERTAC